jgi:hypothetical protein
VSLANEPAFPDPHQGGMYAPATGLTKREYFALHLFAATITTAGAPALMGMNPGEDQCAKAAIRLADTLLAELAKPVTP